MAEALASQRYGNIAKFESAGLFPQPPEDARAALRTLRSEFGIVLPEHKPRNVNALYLDSYTHIIAMDDEIAELLREATTRPLIVWYIADPWAGDTESYRQCAHEIVTHLTSLPLHFEKEGER